MIATTKQLTINEYEHNILGPIINLITKEGKWQGSFQDLCTTINSPLTPRALSQKINTCEKELKNAGVQLTHKKIRGRPIIVLSSSSNSSYGETNCHPAIQTSSEEGIANFTWQYGSIKELTEEEKIEVNNKGKHCSICDEEGNLKYRKINDAYSCLICKSCAEKYVESAKRIMLENREQFT